ncbi:DUF500-domain-containing protein [Aspergillus ellipticus CBS 707.79]|uniref:DUF500-domain-containing protein n=1 Tax=Aspergillus ellipticus CBS 707.79 TaxID=1448320 RepID=A0A319CUD0_9EURO|nr:DUF500-domain-containing protein [Aspergillus ellipticus CBS 707.79]
MPQPVHNPFPGSLQSECSKAAQILESFTNPDAFGSPSRTLPQKILTGAKGLAILTVAKVGFLGSVRIGSGVLVARREDGSWSAPSAIVMVGGGFGGQIGVEVTDFVFILQNDLAVRTFAQLGSLTLGINVSLALGTLGRNGEIAGAVSIGGAVGIVSYGQTKGLFGGASVEGSVIVESRMAINKLYGRKVTARELLGGEVAPPEEARELMQLLQSDVFEGGETKARGPVEPLAGEVVIPVAPELESGMVSEQAAELPSDVPHEVPGGASSEPHAAAQAEDQLPAELPAELPGSAVELSPLPSQARFSIQRKPTPVSPMSASPNPKPATHDSV